MVRLHTWSQRMSPRSCRHREKISKTSKTYILEDSIVDPASGVMETFTRNITHQRLLFVEEHVVYSRSATDPSACVSLLLALCSLLPVVAPTHALGGAARFCECQRASHPACGAGPLPWRSSPLTDSSQTRPRRATHSTTSATRFAASVITSRRQRASNSAKRRDSVCTKSTNVWRPGWRRVFCIFFSLSGFPPRTCSHATPQLLG
jgi:hypothetical protein